MYGVSAEERAKQFIYADGEVLFCKYCQHSIDYIRVDTIKDHLKAQKHISRKEAKLKARQECTVQLHVVAAVWSNIV